jgi:hypothetical protein
MTARCEHGVTFPASCIVCERDAELDFGELIDEGWIRRGEAWQEAVIYGESR